jgi:hypothetical protein
MPAEHNGHFPTLTRNQLAALAVLARRHPDAAVLSYSNGLAHISESDAVRLHDLGLARLEERLYPKVWVALLTDAGSQYAQAKGVV